jgi:hypothetical protein
MNWIERGPEEPSHYKIAQVCLNGHMVTSDIGNYELRSKFCRTCGTSTITACPKCNAGIRGYYYASGVLTLGETPVYPFCHECGSAYPWTEAKIKAARDMADELDELSQEERERLKGTLDDLTRNTPQTEVAVVRFKKLMTKAGKAGANAMRDIVVNIVSEAVKKALLGG